MSKGKGRKRQQPIPAPPVTNPAHTPLNLITLDQFSEKNLDDWRKLSGNLDELAGLLYFAVEPERIRRQPELIEALNSKPSPPIDFKDYVRIVDTRWTLSPLSSVGSLSTYGGRFNIGRDVTMSSRRPFPALYLGEDFPTAYRERYQVEQGEDVDGLTPEELDLSVSTSNYRVHGHIERVIDVSVLQSLSPLAKVLGKFKMPAEATRIAKTLKLKNAADMMIRNSATLQTAVQQTNWRVWPVQYDLPAPSQIFGDLARLAGYEAIRFKSTKSRTGYCLAILSGNLGSDRSYVELSDPAAPEVEFTRLDLSTADNLTGLECLPLSMRQVESHN